MTPDGKYDVDDVKNALGNIVSRNPNVQSGCRYRNVHGGPECIIGHLFTELGLYDVLAHVENSAGVDFLYDEDKDSYDPGFASQFTEPAVTFMVGVQEAQDDGVTWGEALTNRDPEFNPTHETAEELQRDADGDGLNDKG